MIKMNHLKKNSIQLKYLTENTSKVDS